MVVDYGPKMPPEEMPELSGVFVGGCIERGVGSRFGAAGHAHNDPEDEFFGWVCIQSKRRMYTSSGNYSRVLWHEYAHIKTPGHAHDDAWIQVMKELKQPIPSWYKPCSC